MSYRYTLDPKSKKYICPNPDCNKKRFVRYWDTENNEYLPIELGRCDREIKCGYHKTPKDFLKSNNIKSNWTPNKPVKEEIKTFDYLDLKHISIQGYNFQNNNFVTFLLTMFSKETVKEIITRYLLGTISKPWEKSVVFWRLSPDNVLSYGKIMNYNPKTGRKIKEPYLKISSFHKVLYRGKRDSFKYKKALFGMHLINENKTKPIAIVESEKTACIMSAIKSEFIWIASSGISMLDQNVMIDLIDRKIIFYPDLSERNKKGFNAYDIWLRKAEELKEFGFDITVSKFLYELADTEDLENGYDIADYFIEKYQKNKAIPKIETKEIVYIQNRKEKAIDKLISKNPAIKLLIKTFQLQSK
ncbi:hypothetical protein LX97_03239 [Nonlabens dokdonensis]|jgi:hypothetical protein|uniref:DNA primase n=2 Tax=Nonlabens dokdonensis TaxID=328515 RepID=L7W9T1_NONDD|nr:DUF6371 domain-containing protein [Nonlabens dokdonensis]AGC76869.1 hypothetical protein DDD_1742 [Nonlabens dokdonensis DSW-6]PZX36777.1 hypothetical protein LX97_03239 [Nonlabens dokdonensis]